MTCLGRVEGAKEGCKSFVREDDVKMRGEREVIGTFKCGGGFDSIAAKSVIDRTAGCS